jgi:hypothetical protein
MTLIPIHDLTPRDLNQLGSNLAEEAKRDRHDIDPINRSLATLGEALDDLEQAIRSEQVAS